VLTIASIYQGWILRGQLSIAEKAARPYVVAKLQTNNKWTDTTESDVQVTVHGINTSAFPAARVMFSRTRVEFGLDALQKAKSV
jgi:hypothetical protein